MSPVKDFARFADLLPEVMLLVGSDGEVLAANRRVGSLLNGAAPSELVGRKLADLTGNAADDLASWLRACARSRHPMPGALRFRSPDGELTACHATGGVYHPASENTPAVILIHLTARKQAVDPFLALNLRVEELTAQVARRRRAEQALQTEREWLRVTLESIGDAVIATDEQGRVTFMNPVAERLTGWSVQEAGGTPLDDVFVIVNEVSRATVESPVARVLRDGVVVGLANHTVLIRRDGTELPIDDSGAPIRGERSEMLGVVLVFHDVSERRMLERELEKRNRTLLEADQRKDEFLAMLAHELRNPLAPLRTGIGILRMGRSDTEALTALASMMDRQVQHLTHLVDDLLDVSRITRGTIQLSPAPVTLQSVVASALEMVDQQIQEREQRVSLDLPEEDMRVNGDATRLAQVFSNLLSNAAKFSEPRCRIQVTARAGVDEHWVQVVDEGIGIEPELLPKIFELFTQADRSLDRSQGGLGLGLTVARQVVEMHGGRIEARSEGPGRGSELVVILPALGHGPAAGPDQSAVTARPAGAASRRVLVVDDNRDAADALAALVGLWGHEARVAHDGPSALEAANEFEPHVVLLDLGLPGLDGFEVARRMRREPALASTRLFAVTGYGRDQDRQTATEAGFDDHLTKPVDPDVLVGLLAEDDS